MPVIIQGEEAAEAANPRCPPGDGAHKLGAGVDVHAGAQAGARAKGHGRPPSPQESAGIHKEIAPCSELQIKDTIRCFCMYTNTNKKHVAVW